MAFVACRGAIQWTNLESRAYALHRVSAYRVTGLIYVPDVSAKPVIAYDHIAEALSMSLQIAISLNCLYADDACCEGRLVRGCDCDCQARIFIGCQTLHMQITGSPTPYNPSNLPSKVEDSGKFRLPAQTAES